MNIFHKHSYSWWQVGLLKLSLLSLGVAVGSNWPLTLQPYTVWLIIGSIATGLYLVWAWFRQ